MTQDEVIRIAREAGWVIAPATLSGLERFAAFVAAHERDECAKVCEDKWATFDEADIFAALIRARGEK
jgi:hypothetical protein